MSKKLPPCTCDKPDWLGGEEAWRKHKTNVCQRCNGVTEPYVPDKPEPVPPPLMTVFKTSRSITRKVTPYRDQDSRLMDTLTSVDTVRAVQVEELIAWCKANADAGLEDLVESLEGGVFG